MVRWIYLTGKKDTTDGLIDEQLKEQMPNHSFSEYDLEDHATKHKLEQVMHNLDEWVKKHIEEKKEEHFYDTQKEMITFEKPKDWAFMKQSGNVLKNYPATWMTYPNTIEGARGIIDMEYNEYKNAASYQDISHELVHLASACLLLWRKLNNAE
jgi:hypothetical protein